LQDKFLDDIKLVKVLKPTVKELRRIIKQVGILNLKEASMNENGENIKIQKAHVKTI